MSPDLDQIHAVAHARPVADDAAGGREGRRMRLTRARLVVSMEVKFPASVS
jgi:hypothetical protein